LERGARNDHVASVGARLSANRSAARDVRAARRRGTIGLDLVESADLERRRGRRRRSKGATCSLGGGTKTHWPVPALPSVAGRSGAAPSSGGGAANDTSRSRLSRTVHRRRRRCSPGGAKRGGCARVIGSWLRLYRR